MPMLPRIGAGFRLPDRDRLSLPLFCTRERRKFPIFTVDRENGDKSRVRGA